MTEDEIGREAHEAWRKWRVEVGYPDHAWNPIKPVLNGEYPPVCPCGTIQPLHHEDMVDWADLRPEKRVKYQRMGMAGWEARQGEVDRLWRELQENIESARSLLEAAHERWTLAPPVETAVKRAEAAEARVKELDARIIALSAKYDAMRNRAWLAEARIEALKSQVSGLEGERTAAVEMAFPLTNRTDISFTEAVQILIAQRDDANRATERADRRSAALEAEVSQWRRTAQEHGEG